MFRYLPNIGRSSNDSHVGIILTYTKSANSILWCKPFVHLTWNGPFNV